MNLKALLRATFAAMDNMDLQTLQIAGKHTSLSIVQSRQVFRTRLAENAGCEIDEVATHKHGTNGSVAIEIEFF
jgi:hypothetical protein